MLPTTVSRGIMDGVGTALALYNTARQSWKGGLAWVRGLNIALYFL